MLADVSIVLKGPGHPRFMLVSDLDHTMVQNEDPTHERLLQFNRLWTTHFAPDSLLVFSTGRSPNLFAELWDEVPLLTPDILICSVGTELFYRPPGGGPLVPDGSWEAELDKGWDRAAVLDIVARRPRLRPQPNSEQRRHKLSFHLEAGNVGEEDAAMLLEGLRSDLAAAGVAAKVVYSGGIDVDVLAQGAGKGKALEFLLAQLRGLDRWPPSGVQVNGDSGNDAELFTVPGVRGCVVANAHKELLEFYHQQQAQQAAGEDGGSKHAPRIVLATQPCAGGIVEALTAFGSISDAQAAAALASSDEIGAGSSGRPEAAAARAAAVALAPLQGGDTGALEAAAEAGATRATAEGGLVALGGGAATAAAEEPSQAGGGITWADAVAVREVGPGLFLANYQLWSFKEGSRDSGGALACSALLRVVGVNGSRDDAEGGEAAAVKLVHLHEGPLGYDLTATKAFRDLAVSQAATE